MCARAHLRRSQKGKKESKGQTCDVCAEFAFLKGEINLIEADLGIRDTRRASYEEADEAEARQGEPNLTEADLGIRDTRRASYAEAERNARSLASLGEMVQVINDIGASNGSYGDLTTQVFLLGLDLERSIKSSCSRRLGSVDDNDIDALHATIIEQQTTITEQQTAITEQQTAITEMSKTIASLAVPHEGTTI